MAIVIYYSIWDVIYMNRPSKPKALIWKPLKLIDILDQAKITETKSIRRVPRNSVIKMIKKEIRTYFIVFYQTALSSTAYKSPSTFYVYSQVY